MIKIKNNNSDNNINIDVKSTFKLVMDEHVKSDIDAYETFLSERAACDRYRVILTVRPYCTNVLFNACTEISYGEGTDNVSVITDSKQGGYTVVDPSCVSGNTYGLSRYDMVCDTEYSKEEEGYDYHYGLDIFDNHNLRSKTFKSVRPIAGLPSAMQRAVFNKVNDTMRYESNGVDVYNMYWRDVNVPASNVEHIYNRDTLLSFKSGDAIEQRLVADNGWYGFYNGTSVTPYSSDRRSNDYSSVDNSRDRCDFIDLYPDRTLFSFVPKYNAYRNRDEYNWRIFLTYPYDNWYHHNLVSNVFNINNTLSGDGAHDGLLLHSLEYTSGAFGTNTVTLRSYVKHNLTTGDTFRLYRSDNGGLSFDNVGDFRVYKDSDDAGEDRGYAFTTTQYDIMDAIFGDRILSTFYNAVSMSIDFTSYDGDPMTLPTDGSGDLYVSRYELLTPNQDPGGIVWGLEQVSQASVSTLTWTPANTYDAIPDYSYDLPDYIRVFNYFNTNGVAEYTYYKNNKNSFESVPRYRTGLAPTIRVGSDGVYSYYTLTHQFYRLKGDVQTIANTALSNMVFRMKRVKHNYESEYYFRRFKKIPGVTDTHTLAAGAFSTTYYGDPVAVDVITDSVDIENLKDNKGRPLTDIYATVVKNNAGYDEWYNGSTNDRNSEDVEYSHCFGRIRSGIEMHWYAMDDDSTIRSRKALLSDVRTLNELRSGQTPYSFSLEEWDGSSEVTLDDDLFYGDIVEYVPADAREYVLADVCHRFNTVQREYKAYNANGYANGDYLFQYTEIITDDGDCDGFVTETTADLDALLRPEGYYYKTHYRLPVREEGATPRQACNRVLPISDATYDTLGYVTATVKTRHGVALSDTLVMSDKTTGITYEVPVNTIPSDNALSLVPMGLAECTTAGLPYLTPSDIATYLSSGRMVMMVKNTEIPDYAYKIGSNTLIWRDIYRVGDSRAETIETYPFANGHLYLEGHIDFMLRRQDPDGHSGLYYGGTDTLPIKDIAGDITKTSNYKYKDESYSIC